MGRDLGRDVPVLVEVDTGLHRMGRAPGAPTVELASAVARVRGVDVIGLLTHAGHAYRSADAAELQATAEREALDLLETAEACARAGLPSPRDQRGLDADRAHRGARSRASPRSAPAPTS